MPLATLDMPGPAPLTDDARIRALAEEFALGPVQTVRPLGGTATPKWDVSAGRGRFVLRARPAEFAGADATGFDHAVLRRLSAAGFPVPNPQPARDGVSRVCLDGAVYEALAWIDGEAYVEGDRLALTDLGRLLARWHRLLQEPPPGKTGWLREDHPALMRPCLTELRAAARSAGERSGLDRLAEQLDLVESRLDARLYGRLPRAVIHGDVHPGNVRFRAGAVSAVYDFDYLSLQARARDLSDAIILFASRRDTRLDPDAIASLTQPFLPEPDGCRALLAGYGALDELSGEEWQALPLLIRSRWIQMRLRGARKVTEAHRLAMVLDRFFTVIEWLDRDGERFFRDLR